MLFAIGAGTEVVGVSSYDTYPAEATTRRRSARCVDPDFETILSLRPDLVIVYGTQTDLIARLTRVGIPMFRYEHAGLATSRPRFARSAIAWDARPSGATLADGIEADLAAVRARVAGKARPKTAADLRTRGRNAARHLRERRHRVPARHARHRRRRGRRSPTSSGRACRPRRDAAGARARRDSRTARLADVHAGPTRCRARDLAPAAVAAGRARQPGLSAHRRRADRFPDRGSPTAVQPDGAPRSIRQIERKRVLLSWSSGKDSAWALHALQAGSGVRDRRAADDVQRGRRSRGDARRATRRSSRRRRRPRPAARARRRIPSPCPNEVYEARDARGRARARAAGITHMAFGDLFLEDVRRYREDKLAGTGIEPVFPIWGIPTDVLAREMIAGGLRAQITCVDPRQIPAAFAGREWNAALIAELPAGADPCGERGEFHTFCTPGRCSGSRSPSSPAKSSSATGSCSRTAAEELFTTKGTKARRRPGRSDRRSPSS